MSAFLWLIHRSPDGTWSHRIYLRTSTTKIMYIVVVSKTPACSWLFPTHHTHARARVARTVQSLQLLSSHIHTQTHTHTHTHARDVQYFIHAFSVYNTHCSVQTLLTIPPSPRALFNPHPYYTSITLFSPHHTLFIHQTQPSTHFHSTYAPMHMLHAPHHTIFSSHTHSSRTQTLFSLHTTHDTAVHSHTI